MSWARLFATNVFEGEDGGPKVESFFPSTLSLTMRVLESEEVTGAGPGAGPGAFALGVLAIFAGVATLGGIAQWRFCNE